MLLGKGSPGEESADVVVHRRLGLEDGRVCLKSFGSWTRFCDDHLVDVGGDIWQSRPCLDIDDRLSWLSDGDRSRRRGRSSNITRLTAR